MGTMVAPNGGTDITKFEFLLMLLLLGMCNLVVLWVLITMHAAS